jgi:propionyl-CoA synthetase
LRDEVATFAGVLDSLGVSKTNRVIIYMPMIPQTVIAMRARIGAIYLLVFGGFAAKELATRIDDATPKAILCASCGVEFSNVIAYKSLIDEGLQISEHKIDH